MKHLTASVPESRRRVRLMPPDFFMLALPALAFLLAIAAFCTSCESMSEVEKRAERSTYELLSPFALKGIEADSTLSEETRNALRLKVQTWEMRTR